jgi:hypothetical protein
MGGNMYFGPDDEIDHYSRLDIDGDKDIIRFNKHEVDNKSRKNIGACLRSRISKPRYRFNRGICINPDETLEIEIIGEAIDFNNMDSLYIGDIEFKRKRFKNRYENVRMFFVIENGEGSYYLKEGYRYLSLEESCHVVDLVDRSDDNTFYVDADLWIKIQKKV